MITSIELQVISRLLTTESETEIDELCAFDSTYYSVFKEHIEFIYDHRSKYGRVPDEFTFLSQFPNVTLVQVSENLDYLKSELTKNKQHIMLVSMFNKIKDLGSGDVSEAWSYIYNQCEKALQLDSVEPMDLIKDAKKRSDQIIEFAQQQRIPTGFPEIDKLMYGGLSTVEELLLILARTNTGKSWICTKMMESAQGHGFPVLYYSPEMQASFLGTRFDTWRGHFLNSQLYQGHYDEAYYKYIRDLKEEETPAFILEDKDTPSGDVSVRTIETLIKRHGIKLVIVDGLSYMVDDKRGDSDYIRYKNICADLFKLSKRYGCAVVIAMQANRETKDTKDDKGQPFPTLYNTEGSDHPGRICTQAFALRQVFDKHVLDIRLEKSRIANNQKPTLSYAWDANTGNMRYLPSEDDALNAALQPKVNASDIIKKEGHDEASDAALANDSDWDEDEVEF